MSPATPLPRPLSNTNPAAPRLTRNRRVRAAAAALLLLAAPAAAPAQWVSEDYPLVAGWNAIWLSYDATGHLPAGADDPAPIGVVLAGAPADAIEEVWAWNPHASAAQFTQSPSAPVQPDSQWRVWRRGFPADSTLGTLPANTGYLVKVADGEGAFTLTLTGRPVPPKYAWSSTGLNFFGFPVQSPASVADRNFERFLGLSRDLEASPDIFRYVGGPLGEGTNPVRVTAPRNAAVVRGQAYWIRSSTFTDYYGPVRVTVLANGLDYGDDSAVRTLRLRNVTDRPVTAVLEPVDSAVPPGETDVPPPVPLRLRGGLDPATGQFTYVDFDGAETFPLGPGEEVQVVIAADRSRMGSVAGAVFQSLLQLSDDVRQSVDDPVLQISRIDIPVRAVTTSRSGLWVGTAFISRVDLLSVPQPDVEAEDFDPEAAAETVTVISVDDEGESTAKVNRPFPVRLILHRDDADPPNLRLLQQVYLGASAAGQPVVATRESILDPGGLADAIRLSSTTFPVDFNRAGDLVGTGDLGLSGAAGFQVVLGHEASTNPFLHTYHPDHDNRDATFARLDPPPGGDGTEESATVSRAISLLFTADGSALGVPDLEWGSTTLGGVYRETVSGLRAADVRVSGTFVLRRVTDIAELTVDDGPGGSE